MIRQLFITDCKVTGDTITINNPEMLDQMRKVLRLKKGDQVAVQGTEQLTTRYEIEIKDRDDKTLEGKILASTKGKEESTKTGMIIAMPNKRDKIELIVQKLTEIGLDEIIFWPAERSIVKVWNEKKEERLLKIVKEAVEQSRGWKLPKIGFATNLKDVLKNKDVIVFDRTNSEQGTTNSKSKLQELNFKFGLVGPEGGLTEKDYKNLEEVKYEIRSLGETVLRMETAAIVGGRMVKNNF